MLWLFSDFWNTLFELECSCKAFSMLRSLLETLNILGLLPFSGVRAGLSLYFGNLLIEESDDAWKNPR